MPGRVEHTTRLLGPLRRPADVAERLAQADRVAVDARGHDRAEEPRHRVDHRLVDEPEPLGDPALAHQHGADPASPSATRSASLDHPADAQHSVVVPDRGLDVVLDWTAMTSPESPKAARPPNRLAFFEQSLGLLTPAERDRHVLAAGVEDAEIHGQAGGAPVVARRVHERECSLMELDGPSEIADPPGRARARSRSSNSELGAGPTQRNDGEAAGQSKRSNASRASTNAWS